MSPTPAQARARARAVPAMATAGQRVGTSSCAVTRDRGDRPRACRPVPRRRTPPRSTPTRATNRGGTSCELAHGLRTERPRRQPPYRRRVAGARSVSATLHREVRTQQCRPRRVRPRLLTRPFGDASLTQSRACRSPANPSLQLVRSNARGRPREPEAQYRPMTGRRLLGVRAVAGLAAPELPRRPAEGRTTWRP